MASGMSDRGDREHQEDAWLVVERPEATLCAVCDGMGASTSGHPAAALTLSFLRSAFEASVVPDVVFDAMRLANRTIVDRSGAARRGAPGSDARWQGMGTTAEVAIFLPGRVHLGHIGDGSIFRFRAGTLESMTVAHSLVNEVRRQRPEVIGAELDRVPRGIIVRALGMSADLEIDRDVVETLPGDVWLLCSDGLTSLLSDADIARPLGSGGSVSEMSRSLLELALSVTDEPRDNIALVVHVVGG